MHWNLDVILSMLYYDWNLLFHSCSRGCLSILCWILYDRWTPISVIHYLWWSDRHLWRKWGQSALLVFLSLNWIYFLFIKVFVGPIQIWIARFSWVVGDKDCPNRLLIFRCCFQSNGRNYSFFVAVTKFFKTVAH